MMHFCACHGYKLKAHENLRIHPRKRPTTYLEGVKMITATIELL